MKTLLAITMVLVFLSGSAFAGSGRTLSYLGSTSGPITQVGTVLQGRGANVYNLTLNATSALATLVIYDGNALSNNAIPSNEVAVYEVEVAVAGDSRSVDFSTAPLQTYTGLIASVTNGVGYINKE